MLIDNLLNLENYSQKEPHEHIIEHSKYLWYLDNSLLALQSKVQRLEEQISAQSQINLVTYDNMRANINLLESKLSVTVSMPEANTQSSGELEQIKQQIEQLHILVTENQVKVDPKLEVIPIVRECVQISKLELESISIMLFITFKLKSLLKKLKLVK